MFAKRLFYVSASLFLLALAYHLGASTATAQAPSNPVVAIGGNTIVVTANGDVYEGTNFSGGAPVTWTLKANVFSGAPVPTHQSSWGALKVQSR